MANGPWWNGKIPVAQNGCVVLSPAEMRHKYLPLWPSPSLVAGEWVKVADLCDTFLDLAEHNVVPRCDDEV